jgi:late competence protein required for DNA uptake (superfamily II DNA/RNA helicase)
MANIFRSGKQNRPKIAVKGKRYRCAKCRKRSPKPVKIPAPWYCDNCLAVRGSSTLGQ